MKEGSEKADLKLNIQKMKIIPSGPITSWQIGGDTMDVSLSVLREFVMDREAWHAAIHGVAKSQTRLSD